MNFDALISDLKRDEGFRAHVYFDHLGFATLGFGFLVDERRGAGLPREVADYWLETELEERWSELVSAIPWLLEQPEEVQQALGNMSWQLGVRGVLGFRKMLAALETGDREKAAEEALDSVWSQQTPERAERISELIRG